MKKLEMGAEIFVKCSEVVKSREKSKKVLLLLSKSLHKYENITSKLFKKSCPILWVENLHSLRTKLFLPFLLSPLFITDFSAFKTVYFSRQTFPIIGQNCGTFSLFAKPFLAGNEICQHFLLSNFQKSKLVFHDIRLVT